LAALLAIGPSPGTIRGDAAGRDAPPVPPGVVVVEGVSTAWCAPGQTLLGGGYDLALGEPAPPPAKDAPPVPPQHVAVSRPTARYDAHGAVAQTGWTALLSTLEGPSGPLVAYALCAGDAVPVAVSDPLPPPPRFEESQPPRAVAAPLLDAAAVVERVGPAVVTVITKQRPDGGGEPRPVGSGSGFFVDDAGDIVTNEHVVRDGDAFAVILATGEERPAELVGADRASDLAVLRVDGPVPAVAPLGDSDALRPGEPVLAVGSPLGTFTNTVTDGIVGALGRTVPEAEHEVELLDLIQHNAAINPGNSGGPLVTLAGEVVGVNTLGIPEAQGLFFAVPARTVITVGAQLVAAGRVVYPYLGIEALPLTDLLIAQYELPAEDGAYVRRVVPDGPADRAGVEPGDIVVAVAGEPVGADRSLAGVLFAHAAGERVEVRVRRGGLTLRLTVTLAERPGA